MKLKFGDKIRYNNAKCVFIRHETNKIFMLKGTAYIQSKTTGFYGELKRIKKGWNSK